MSSDKPTAEERAELEALEEKPRPAIAETWCRTPRTAGAAVVAGATVDVMRVLNGGGSRAPYVVLVVRQSVVVDALCRARELELLETFLSQRDPRVIPVLMCGPAHVAMAYEVPVPVGAVTVGKGGDA